MWNKLKSLFCKPETTVGTGNITQEDSLIESPHKRVDIDTYREKVYLKLDEIKSDVIPDLTEYLKEVKIRLEESITPETNEADGGEYFIFREDLNRAIAEVTRLSSWENTKDLFDKISNIKEELTGSTLKAFKDSIVELLGSVNEYKRIVKDVSPTYLTGDAKTISYVLRGLKAVMEDGNRGK